MVVVVAVVIGRAKLSMPMALPLPLLITMRRVVGARKVVGVGVRRSSSGHVP